MDKEELIENTRKHIKQIRKNSPDLTQRDVKISLGKVIIELRDAQKNNNQVLKNLFTL